MRTFQLSYVLTFSFLISNLVGLSQTYPSYGPEKDVTINGLTFDAMEPFLSSDENYLFFNNLNDGITTRLYYATKINDSTFTFIGELTGANQPIPPHLDAVADMDSLGNFYWTSGRDYPANYDNVHRGDFSAGNITNIGRVHGDFYIYSPGWILMDHGISYDGQLLYFNNAYFNSCPGPCQTYIGVAQKVNDSTFTTLPNSDGIMQNINDTNYIYYAPCVTADNLEFYYTRFLKDNVTSATMVDICVSVRITLADTFSVPMVLFSDSVTNIVEAPTLTADKQIMYYHKKVSGSHEIKLRNRLSTAEVPEINMNSNQLRIYPNPMNGLTRIKFEIVEGESYTVKLLDELGRIVKTISEVTSGMVELKKGNLDSGRYLIQLISGKDVIDQTSLIIQ